MSIIMVFLEDNSLFFWQTSFMSMLGYCSYFSLFLLCSVTDCHIILVLVSKFLVFCAYCLKLFLLTRFNRDNFEILKTNQCETYFNFLFFNSFSQLNIFHFQQAAISSLQPTMRPRSYMRPLAPASSVRVPPTVHPTVDHDTQKIPLNAEVLITQSPQQTKPNVHMNVNGKCIVCSKFALYLCSKCQLFWYCSPQCQVSRRSPFS